MQDLTYRETGECELDADFAAVPGALERMRDYCISRGLAQSNWQGIELAAAEAVNNAIQHGCRGHPGARVHLAWRWRDDCLEITASDPGHYEPGPSGPELPEDPLAESGRGQFLMARLMDEVRHENDAAGHRVILTKRVGAATRIEAAVAAAEATIQSMTEELSVTYENLAALLQFAESLATAGSFDGFTDVALKRLCALIGASFASFRVVEPGGELGPARGVRPPHPVPDSAAGDSAEAAVFRGGQERTIEDLSRLDRGDPLRGEGGSCFICPIFFRDRIIGVLAVGKPGGAPFFTAGELALTRTVADFLGIARTTSLLELERQEQQRRVRELEIAASIQQSLLPRKFPGNQRVRIFGACAPAQEVGGDFFDVIELDPKGILLVIADVMGKGVPAALLASVFRTAIRSRLDLAEDPGRLLREVNRQISQDLVELEMFITAQVAFLRYEDSLLRLSNAGHCPVIQISGDGGRTSRLLAEGFPLGLFGDNPYETVTIPVAAGDRLLFLTDGLYEFPDAEDPAAGQDGLVAEAARAHAQDAREFCDRLLRWARDADRGRPARDDRTLLVVDRMGEQS